MSGLIAICPSRLVSRREEQLQRGHGHVCRLSVFLDTC